MAVQGPDSGFSWVVVLCCAYIHFALFGLFRSAGVMYVAVLQNYEVTREEASWPFSLCAAVFQLVGPLASILMLRISQRKVCLMGAVVATLGVGACYFAYNVMWIIIFYGIIHGLGFGFIVTVVPITLNQYFVKYRATAMGIAFSGGTVSSLIFPSIMEWLLEQYTIRDSFLLLSGLVMNTLVAASFLKEPSWLSQPTQRLSSDCPEVALDHSNKKNGHMLMECPASNLKADLVGNECSVTDKRKSSLNEHGLEKDSATNHVEECGYPTLKDFQMSNGNGGYSKLEQSPVLDDPEQYFNHKSPGESNLNPDCALYDPIKNIEHAAATVPVNHDFISNNINDFKAKEPLLNDKKVTILPKIMPTVAKTKKKTTFFKTVWDILREPVFHLIVSTMCIYFLTVHSFFMVIVDFAKDKGIEESKAIYIISMFSLTDMFGRAGLGWVTDGNYISRKTMVAGNLAVLGVLSQLYPLINSLEGILAVSAIHGLAVGSSITLFFVLQAECLGMERLSTVVGLISFINGILSLFRPGLIGLFRDVIGAYDWMFHSLGFVCMVFSVIWMLPSLGPKSNNSKHAEKA